MQIRDYSLPRGWFPHDAGAVTEFLSNFPRLQTAGQAAIVPHAGWYYSGRLAALGAASLKPDAETIIVLGGHLSAGAPALFAAEDAVKTPFGHLLIDAALRQNMIKELDGAEDCYRDNTIEVLLPMVHYFFPKASLLWLRLPAEIESFEAGKTLSRIAAKLGRKVNVLASTDLTHYGSNYGFSPKGSGKAALTWVREVNDAAFIKAVEAGDSAEVLRRAEREHSACSPGAVLGVMGFAEAQGLGSAQLLEYATSVDVTSTDIKTDDEIPGSFVGYAAFTFDKQ